MSATVEIICYKQKVLSNNEMPLMLRITKDRKRKYSSINISVKPENWDFVRNKPKSNCPNRELIIQITNDIQQSYLQKILELRADKRDFTAQTLFEHVNKKVERRTVEDVFISYMEQLREENRVGYALTLQETFNSMLKYNGHLKILFPDIDVTWLKEYEHWLNTFDYSKNTLGRRFRTLRVVYNFAIERGIVNREYYPFEIYKVSKHQQATAKRAISKEDILRVFSYKSDNEYTILAIKLFRFSYYMGGINFVDMALLTRDNIVDSRLVYYRKKTGKLIQLPMHPSVLDIVNDNLEEDAKYIFPILSSFHKTEQQRRNRVHKVIAKVNNHLKNIGVELGIPITLTTYVARHSFATVLKRSGVSTSVISESLGHSSEKVTQIYLDSFGNSQIEEAMRNL